LTRRILGCKFFSWIDGQGPIQIFRRGTFLQHHTREKVLLGKQKRELGRQVRLVSRIYTHFTYLDLLRQRPLYEFSGLAARTAFGLVILNLVVDATSPGAFSQPGSLGLTLVLVIMAVITFLWPLMGVHRRLQAEKGRLLRETTKRFLAAIMELHQRVDDAKLSAMDEIDATLSSLAQEAKKIAAIPTWPWQPDQIRLLVSTILLPIVLWIDQQIVPKVIGR
jgi:hypothetical protein